MKQTASAATDHLSSASCVRHRGTMNGQNIRIRLKGVRSSYPRCVDARRSSTRAKRTGAQVRGPIPLPTQIEKFTVNRSPHIDKKSREQFEMRTISALLDIVDPTPQTVGCADEARSRRRRRRRDQALRRGRGVAMRSGVIAQKIRMMRLFTESGEHVPVTVLRLGNCQVVAHRTRRTTATSRSSSAPACARCSARPRPTRGHFAVAKVEPKRKLAEFRVDADALIPGRRRDHRRPLRRRPVCRRDRHLDRQGFRRPDEALELRWSFAASHGVSASHRSHGSTGGRQDPGARPSRTRRWPGHMGVERVTTLNLKVVQTDVERGLILVEGASPASRAAGSRCATPVKKKLPTACRSPARFKLAGAAAEAGRGGDDGAAEPSAPAEPAAKGA